MIDKLLYWLQFINKQMMLCWPKPIAWLHRIRLANNFKIIQHNYISIIKVQNRVRTKNRNTTYNIGEPQRYNNSLAELVNQKRIGWLPAMAGLKDSKAARIRPLHLEPYSEQSQSIASAQAKRNFTHFTRVFETNSDKILSQSGKSVSTPFYIVYRYFVHPFLRKTTPSQDLALILENRTEKIKLKNECLVKLQIWHVSMEYLKQRLKSFCGCPKTVNP